MEALILLSLMIGGIIALDPFDDDDDSRLPPEDGDDTAAGSGDDTLQAADGGERLNGEEGNDLILGSDDDDRLFGDAGDDTLRGGRGDDIVGGGHGDDEVSGGLGHDTVYGWYGDDTVDGGFGDDTVSGDDGSDLVRGGPGNDYFDFRDPGLDTLLGGAGDDRILTRTLPWDDGPRASVIDGGPGDDILGFEDGSTVTGGTGADDLRLSSDLADSAPSRITDFDVEEDTLLINLRTAPDNPGPLALSENADADGMELFFGETLIADIRGSTGYTLDDLNISLRLGEGAATLEGGDEGATMPDNGLDNTITGGAGDDFILTSESNGSSNLFDGGAGDDTLEGHGADIRYFDADDDSGPLRLEGGIHTDTLIGGAGDDVLLAFDGAEMTGGEGADTFGVDHDLLPEAQEEGFVFPPARITDFDPDEDVIVLDEYHVAGIDMLEDLDVVPWDDDTGADIRLGDTVVARVTGGQDLSVADIAIVDWLGTYRPPG